MDTWAILLALLCVICAIYYFFIKEGNHLKKYGVPYINRLANIGFTVKLFTHRMSVSEFITVLYNIHPEAKYVGIYDFTNTSVVIRDPELIKSIALKNFEHFMDHRAFVDEKVDPLFGKNLFALQGQRWKEMRSLLSPAFTSSKMKIMFKLMSECAVNFAEYWQNVPAAVSNCVDMKDACTRYTNDVIATCAFGIKVDSIRDRENEFFVHGRALNSGNTLLTLKIFFISLFPRISKLLRLKMFGTRLRDFFMNIVKTTISTRDEQGITRPDMIQLMMETRGHRGEKELTIEDMTSQAFIFFFAGFESTATMMCFAAHEIAVNPDVRERLQKEIDQVVEETKGDLTYEALNKMKYMNAILYEAMRKYPVTPSTDRVCLKDFELPATLPDSKPVTLKKGSFVTFPIYGLHMDPQYFSEPEKFDPDRFLGDNHEFTNSGYYLPFGLGPRMCIGNRFALLETKIMLFHLLLRCDLIPCEKTPKTIVFSTKTFNVMPKDGFWLKIQPRYPTH